MQAPTSIYHSTFEELVERILCHRRITRAEAQHLQITLSSHFEYLNEEQKALIQRVLYGVRHGLLSLVD